MLPTQTAAAIEKVIANPMISHMAPAAKLRRGSILLTLVMAPR
jgi:hypothetical protein